MNKIEISIAGEAGKTRYPLNALIDLLYEVLDDLSNSAEIIADKKGGYPIFGDFEDDYGSHLKVEVKEVE